MVKERALGAVLGAAVADSFATTAEFSSPSGLPDYPTMLPGPQVDIIGAGPFLVFPGMTTDDSELTAAVAASLEAASGTFDPMDAAARLIRYRTAAFDVGGQVGGAVSLMSSCLRASHHAGTEKELPAMLARAGLAAWTSSGRNCAGNGSLMMASPFGVWGALHSNIPIMKAVAQQFAAFTHFDPRCQLASAAYTAAIGHGILGVSRVEMVEAAREALAPAGSRYLAQFPSEPSPLGALADLTRDLEMAERDNPDLYGADVHILEKVGFVRTAFRLAFWHLLHSPSYRASIVDITNRGGDSDTNACIAGGLLGAHYGFGPQGVPGEWREQVLAALPVERAGKTKWHPDLHTEFHPRVTVALVEKWSGRAAR